MPFDIDGKNLEAFHVSEAFETMSCRCSECDWEGVGSDLGLQFQGRQNWASCPNCFNDLAIITAFTEEEYQASYIGERYREFVASCKRKQTTDPKVLPSIKGLGLEFTWDIEEQEDGPNDYVVVTCKDQEVFRELAYWKNQDRFDEVNDMLKGRYGIRFREMSPTFQSIVYLYGGERPPEIDDILNKMSD
jgi:hypothetical protein